MLDTLCRRAWDGPPTSVQVKGSSALQMGRNLFVTGAVPLMETREQDMGRCFNFEHDGQTLSVRPMAVDEGWELWVMEGEKRLICGAWLTIDEVVRAGRQGQDRIRTAFDEIRNQIVSGRLTLRKPDRSAA